MAHLPHIRLYWPLIPFAWAYGLAVSIRNSLFDHGVLKSRIFDTPVISVGNITVGGTGKTPHVEYIVRLLLGESRHIAVLSRGYKRKTKGFLVATKGTTSADIGDEPYQIHRKFSAATVAVCADRCEGIERLTANEAFDAIVLDDAYQHRYVKPKLNLLLVDNRRLLCDDYMMPVGRLREPSKGCRRADAVVVTKCSPDITLAERQFIQHKLNLNPSQQLFFTTIQYADLIPIVSTKAEQSLALSSCNKQNVLLLTGIASPQYLHQHITQRVHSVSSLSYPDHHQFTQSDIQTIQQTFDALPEPRMLITTEKDATRLAPLATSFSVELQSSAFMIPITIAFIYKEAEFIKLIHDTL